MKFAEIARQTLETVKVDFYHLELVVMAAVLSIGLAGNFGTVVRGIVPIDSSLDPIPVMFIIFIGGGS